MTFNKCREWNVEFSDVLGVDIEHLRQADLDRMADVICVWEVGDAHAQVLRLAAADAEALEFVSSEASSFSGVRPAAGGIGREFDLCVERGLAKAAVLFRELVDVAAVLRGYYAPAGPARPGDVRAKHCHLKSPANFKIKRAVRTTMSMSTDNTSNGSGGARPGGAEANGPKRALPFALVKNYVVLHLLNEGSVGRVHLAVDRRRGMFAVKVIPKVDDFHAFGKIKEELIIAGKLKHEHVVETFLIVETRHSLLLFMEYCAGGDLITFIRRAGRVHEQAARNAFKMLVRAVRHLHDNNVYHRDIKPENIFLKGVRRASGAKGPNCPGGAEADGPRGAEAAPPGPTNDLSSYTLKLGDFGASIRAKRDTMLFEVVGTMSYAAPEVLEGASGYLGEKADVWSLGVVLYAMVFGQLPYVTQEDTVKAVLSKILSSRLAFPKIAASGELKALIAGMLEVSPHKRMSLREVWNHEWLTGRKARPREAEAARKSEGGCVLTGVDGALNVILDEML